MEDQLLKDLFSKQKLPGAILINGDWGSGKTYFWTKKIMPRLTEVGAVYISAFGCESINQIKSDLLARRILSNTTADDSFKSFTKLIKNSSTAIAQAVGGLVEKQVGINPIEVFKQLVPNVDPLEFFPNGAIVCIDDIERCGSDLALKILGMISQLIEEKDAKVVVLTDENKLNDLIKEKPYGEKVVWKSYNLELDTVEIVSSLISKFSSEKSGKYLKAIAENISKAFENADCKNIRTINKIIRLLSELSDCGVKLGPAHIQYLVYLYIYKVENGKLSENHEVYSYGKSFSIAYNIDKNKANNSNKIIELDEESKESLKFYLRFNKLQDTTSFTSIYDLVKTNKINVKDILNEIKPSDEHKPEAKHASFLMSKYWVFENEKKVKKHYDKAIKFIKSKKLNIKTAVGLIYGCLLLVEALEEGQSDIIAASDFYIDSLQAVSGSKRDWSWFLRDVEQKHLETMNKFYNKLEARQIKVNAIKLKKLLMGKFNKKERIDLYLFNHEDLKGLKKLAVDNDVHEKAENIFYENPISYYDFYFYLKNIADENQWEKSIKDFVKDRLVKFSKLKNLDKIQKAQVDILIKRYKS